MIARCGHCGAPLDVEEGRTVVTCAYCAKKNRVAEIETISPTTPADFEPPKVWQPQAESEPLPYRPRREGGGGRKVVLVLLALLVLGGGGYLAFTQGSTVEEITALPLESSPREIEKKLHVTYATDDSARVTLRSGAAGPYEHVVYLWADKDFSLPEGIGLQVAEGAVIGPKVIPTLNESLHGGIGDQGLWSWGAASLVVDRKTGAINIQVKATIDDRPNLDRRRQLAALWQVARQAAFGGPPVARDELVAVLGGGYPLPKLGDFDPTTSFGKAKAAVQALFPGALPDGPTAFRVATDHPLLQSVSLSWHNAAEGKLHGVHFRVTPAWSGRLPAFVACLEREAGTPEKHVSDFAKGTVRTTFRVGASADQRPTLDMNVGDEANLYFVAQSERFEPAAWRRAFAAVDRCR